MPRAFLLPPQKKLSIIERLIISLRVALALQSPCRYVSRQRRYEAGPQQVQQPREFFLVFEVSLVGCGPMTYNPVSFCGCTNRCEVAKGRNHTELNGASSTSGRLLYRRVSSTQAATPRIKTDGLWSRVASMSVAMRSAMHKTNGSGSLPASYS